MIAARTDRNQAEIAEALRMFGATVHCAHGMGEGFPDLVVGYLKEVILIEIKDGPGKYLTPAQVKWHQEWHGKSFVAESAHDAMAAINGFLPSIAGLTDHKWLRKRGGKAG